MESRKEFESLLKQISSLNKELEWYLPLNPGLNKELWNKVKLDWNFHSNKMEGIKISFEQVQQLMLKTGHLPGSQTKDSIQVVGHDEAIDEILELSQSDISLTEHFIRGLHKILLKETYYNPAKTLDGLPSKKRVIIGDYKSMPNNVETSEGVFYYSTPEETRIEMPQLLKKCNEEIENQLRHPLEIAAQFHYEFIKIHPFDDGNGRMARLLTNYILLKTDYPPIIIKYESKEEYINALRLGDKGSILNLNIFFAKQLISSQALYLDVLKSGKVFKQGDLQNKILVLTKKLENQYMKTAMNNQIVLQTVKLVYIPFLNEVSKKTDLLKHLFVKNVWGYFEEPKPPEYLIPMMPKEIELGQLINHFVELARKGDSHHQFKAMNWLTHLRYRQNSESVEVAFKLFLFEFEYEILVSIGKPLESGMLIKAFKDIMNEITKGKGPFKGFDYVLCKNDYGTYPANSDIERWAEDLGHKLVDYIEKVSIVKNDSDDIKAIN